MPGTCSSRAAIRPPEPPPTIAMRGLSDAEVETLMALLRRMLANVEAMEG